MAKKKVPAKVIVKLEQVDSRVGMVFRVAYHSAKTGKLLNYLMNESCHVTRDHKKALIKLNRKDAESNGAWCAGKKPTWPIGKRQKAYARFLSGGYNQKEL